MKQVVIGIHGKLTKDGATDMDLLVHSYYLDRPSPCVVIQDGVNKGVIGGSIESVEQIFQLEVSKHPGWVVKERQDLIAVIPEPNEKAEGDVGLTQGLKS
jgi:hypothetical protein